MHEINGVKNYLTSWKKVKLNHCLSPYFLKNSQWIKPINVKMETVND